MGENKCLHIFIDETGSPNIPEDVETEVRFVGICAVSTEEPENLRERILSECKDKGIRTPLHAHDDDKDKRKEFLSIIVGTNPEAKVVFYDKKYLSTEGHPKDIYNALIMKGFGNVFFSPAAHIYVEEHTALDINRLRVGLDDYRNTTVFRRILASDTESEVYENPTVTFTEVKKKNGEPIIWIADYISWVTHRAYRSLEKEATGQPVDISASEDEYFRLIKPIYAGYLLSEDKNKSGIAMDIYHFGIPRIGGIG